MSSFYFIFIGLCITCSCHNASSQLSDGIARTGQECGSNAFTCEDDHKCIPLFFRCDLKYDCTDGSDEEGCKERQCPERSHRCDWGRCIPDMFVCDGEIDCIDISDEKDCPHTRKQCGSNAFTCADDHKCIPLFFRCDLKHDCTDGSDEEGCEERQCPERSHRCDWGRCIPDMFVCDGEMDCIDLSDEKDCHQQDLSTTEPTPQSTEPTPQPTEPTPQPTEPALIVPPVNDGCMQCLCQAASGCDKRLQCVKRTPSSSTLCGPYVVSEYYWMDGGRHADRGKPKDYERCLTNRICTEKTVRGYMKRYGQDCDQDSRITCDDFARIHKLGPSSCGGGAIKSTTYWQRYEACKRRIRVE